MQPDRPTGREMLGEIVDLIGGAGILLLPLLVTALPGVILFILAPALLVLVLAAIPAAIAGAVAAPLYLLARLVRRRRARRAARSGGEAF